MSRCVKMRGQCNFTNEEERIKNSMKCRNCGHEVGTGDSFCEKCGSQIAKEETSKPKRIWIPMVIILVLICGVLGGIGWTTYKLNKKEPERKGESQNAKMLSGDALKQKLEESEQREYVEGLANCLPLVGLQEEMDEESAGLLYSSLFYGSYMAQVRKDENGEGYDVLSEGLVSFDNETAVWDESVITELMDICGIDIPPEETAISQVVKKEGSQYIGKDLLTDGSAYRQSIIKNMVSRDDLLLVYYDLIEGSGSVGTNIRTPYTLILKGASNESGFEVISNSEHTLSAVTLAEVAENAKRDKDFLMGLAPSIHNMNSESIVNNIDGVLYTAISKEAIISVTKYNMGNPYRIMKSERCDTDTRTYTYSETSLEVPLSILGADINMVGESGAVMKEGLYREGTDINFCYDGFSVPIAEIGHYTHIEINEDENCVYLYYILGPEGVYTQVDSENIIRGRLVLSLADNEFGYMISGSEELPWDTEEGLRKSDARSILASLESVTFLGQNSEQMMSAEEIERQYSIWNNEYFHLLETLEEYLEEDKKAVLEEDRKRHEATMEEIKGWDNRHVLMRDLLYELVGKYPASMWVESDTTKISEEVATNINNWEDAYQFAKVVLESQGEYVGTGCMEDRNSDNGDVFYLRIFDDMGSHIATTHHLAVYRDGRIYDELFQKWIN